MFCLQVVILNDVGSLYKYVDKTELTPCLGGTLNYDHQDWVQHRTVSCSSKAGYTKAGYSSVSGQCFFQAF
jgi:hypothetical protein